MAPTPRSLWLWLTVAPASLLGFLPADVSAQTDLQATGGTFNYRADGTLGTVVFYTFRGEADHVGTYVLILRGPPDWPGRARVWTVRRPGAGLKWDVAPFVNRPVPGSYSLSFVLLDGKEVGTTRFSIGTLSVLPRSVVKVAAEQARVVVAWAPISGALSYEVKLVDMQRRRTVEATLTRAASQAFDVVLTPGPYRAEVRAYPIDLTQAVPTSFPLQFNSSEGTAEFNVP